MGKSKDENIVGTRIGIYDVLYECDYKANDGHRLYHIRCIECGWETDIKKDSIRRLSNICTHVGFDGRYIDYHIKWSNKRLKNIFNGMKKRCYDELLDDYRWYGAKGIKVCDEWLNNPKLFEEWALHNGYADDLTIDRIDSGKHYCPENCRWIPAIQNVKYKSTTSVIDVDGEQYTGRDWASKLGLSVNVINNYMRKYGEDNVKEFIRRRLTNPDLKPKRSQSYYNLYMNKN